jgi:hypothetical protein
MGVTLRKEHRFMTFEKRVLMTIFGPRKKQNTGENCLMSKVKKKERYPATRHGGAWGERGIAPTHS